MNIDIIMFATPNLSVYTNFSIAGWKKYTESHGYQFTHYEKPYYQDLHIAWSKIRSVREHLGQSKADYIVLVDADTIPTSCEVSIESLIDQFMQGKKQLLFQKDGGHYLKYIYLPHNWSTAFKLKRATLPNAGFIIMKNNDDVKKFFDEWLSRVHTSPLADVPPRNQNVLNFEMLCQKHIDEMVGFVETWVINRYGGQLCRHFSSMSPEVVKNKMQAYYHRLMHSQTNRKDEHEYAKKTLP